MFQVIWLRVIAAGDFRAILAGMMLLVPDNYKAFGRKRIRKLGIGRLGDGQIGMRQMGIGQLGIGDQ
jgi:hypothetical protein